MYGARVAGQGFWREARFRFEEAVRLNPGSARAHNDLAVSLEALGEFPLAFEEYKKAVSLDSASRPRCGPQMPDKFQRPKRRCSRFPAKQRLRFKPFRRELSRSLKFK